jgi:hypothetical protein
MNDGGVEELAKKRPHFPYGKWILRLDGETPFPVR